MTFFFTAIFMFMVFWRPQEWLLPWMFGWPVLDIVVGFALLMLAIELNEGRLRMPKDMPQVKLLLGLWIAAPLSHVPHTYFAGLTASIMPVFKICFFSFLLMVATDRPKRLRTASLLFVAMGITMAFHVFLQMKRGYGFGRLPPIDNDPEYYRAQFFGIFSDPNDLAQFLVTCVPFTFVLTRSFNVMSFLLGAGISWYLIAAMLETHSRGGLVGLVVTVGTQIALWFPRRWFRWLMFAGFALFLGLCAVSGSGMDASAQGRVVFWGLANQLFKRNPIFGIGYEMAWIVTDKGLALHNAFVTCYTELGLFGYWFWFLLIQLGIVGAFRTRVALRYVDDPQARWLRRLAGQTIAAMIGFCASAYFLSRTFIFPLFFLIAMLAAIPHMARPYLPARYPPMFNRRKDMYIMGTVGVVISVVYIYLSCVILNRAYYG
jgi:putative inorganic carbon (HCO3(-)) transporter